MKHPFKKATAAEIQLRIEQCARWLGSCQQTRFEIHRLANEKWNVSWRTTDRYLTHARRFMLQRIGKTKNDVFGEAVMFYEEVIRSNKATLSEKLKARLRIDELFAIDPPKIIRQKIEGGEACARPIEMQVNSSSHSYRPFKGVPKEQLRAALDALTKGNGNPPAANPTPANSL